jgi:plastocyanin
MKNVRAGICALATVAALWTPPALRASTASAAQGAKPAKEPAKTVAIDIDNFKFGIVSLEVAAGTTVTWTNRDDVPHTVVSLKKVFKSPALDTGEHFSYTFTDTGTFDYYCSVHPRMTGTIVVK